jgi:hypothetical protein
MNQAAQPSSAGDPFAVLGLPPGAGEQDVRARYLELVREFPPERDPARFQEIHAAYQSASDPLVLAQRLVRVTDDAARPWSAILDEQKANPPRLSVDVLLSLGNRTAGTSSTSEDSA